MMCNCQFPMNLKKITDEKTNGVYRSHYRRWVSMHSRCYDEKHHKFEIYGKKNILVCKQWHSFNQFCKDIGEIPNKMFIDRIDGNKGYCPHNVKLSSFTEQNINRFKFDKCSNLFKGVYYRKDKNKFHAQLHVNDKRIHIGYFKDADKAYHEYKVAYFEWYGKKPPERRVPNENDLNS